LRLALSAALAGPKLVLTPLEQQVFDAIEANAFACSGGDFACLEEVRIKGLNRQQLGGVVTSLETKGVISVDITYVNEGVTSTGRRTKGDKVTQVTSDHFKR